MCRTRSFWFQGSFKASSSFAAGKGFSLSLLLNTPFEVIRFGQLFEKFFFFFTAFFLHSVILKNSQMTETEGPGSEGKTTAFDIEKAHSQHKVGCALSFCYGKSGGA